MCQYKSMHMCQCINTPSSLSLKWRGGSNFLPSPIPLLISPPSSSLPPSSYSPFLLSTSLSPFLVSLPFLISSSISSSPTPLLLATPTKMGTTSYSLWTV